MKGKRLPSLPDTGRRYVEQTMRTRLASPGIERYSRPRGQGARAIAISLLLAAVLVGAMLWLS